MALERILVADREPKMLSLLRQVFSVSGYEVITTAKGEQAVQIAAVEQPSLIILDVVLDGAIDGYEVVHRVREFSEAPIILLSVYDDSEDVLRGFNMGADDFVIKPFDPKILLARGRSLLKRYHSQSSPPGEIVCNDLVIDIAARRVMQNDVEIYLTDTEYNLLLELARHRDRVLMHDQLLVAVWGKEYRNEVGYLRSYIHILRRKLEPNPSKPRLILSRPGIGYMLITAQEDNAGE